MFRKIAGAYQATAVSDIVGIMSKAPAGQAESLAIFDIFRALDAMTAELLAYFELHVESKKRELMRRATMLARDLACDISAPEKKSIFSLFRIISLLNRLHASGELKCIDSISQLLARTICETRNAVHVIHAGLYPEEKTHVFGHGEHLPFERETESYKGKILLAVEPVLAEAIRPVLNRLDHVPLIVQNGDELLASLGLVKDEARPSGQEFQMADSEQGSGPKRISIAIDGRLETYSLGYGFQLPDVIITDLFSAGFAGFEIQELLKSFSRLADIPVIIVSPLLDSRIIARAIQLGADDVLRYSVEPSVFFARIESSIERNKLREKHLFNVIALAKTRARLESELKAGAEYVRCLLPGKIKSPLVSTDWVFIPSASLGGDLFGYHRLMDGRISVFMIDVSGHGVQSALYSVTIFDTLRLEGLRNTDFGDPASVLRSLNHAYRMEERNNLLFTVWYGVWDERTRTLVHASAGSPPAVLILPGGGAVELKSPGLVAGADPDADYENMSIQIPRNSRLFLFSDGIYEFPARNGEIFGLEAFVQLLEKTAVSASETMMSVGEIIARVKEQGRLGRFEDDVSLLEFSFG